MQNLSGKLDIIFTALANPKRRSIIHSLALKPSTVAQLAEENGLTLPAIHKHMHILEQAKLVQRKKVGRVNFVSINRHGLGLAKDWVMEYRVNWGSDSETLENYIARMRE